MSAVAKKIGKEVRARQYGNSSSSSYPPADAARRVPRLNAGKGDGMSGSEGEDDGGDEGAGV